MLLRNYYNLLALLTMGVTSTDTSTFGDGHLNLKRASNGSLNDTSFSTPVSYSSLGRLPTTAIGYDNLIGGGSILLGSGNTAVTFDDYALASIISSGWTKGTPIVGTPAYNSETKKWTNTISFVCTNTSGSTMTIREVGIGNGPFSSNSTVLVYREVLATPVEIENGASKTITLNLEYTMPTV
jgi:hypothetical protein